MRFLTRYLGPMLAGVVSWLAILAVAQPAQAEPVQLFEWKSVNTQGMGWVTGLIVHPKDPFDVYIRTDVGGCYRFDRTAARWIPLTDALETQAGAGTESIAIDPSNPSRVYAVMNRALSTSGGKFKYAAEIMVSEDRGQTWRSSGFVQNNVYQGANDDYRVETGERLAVDPNNPGILYFASRRNGLWRGTRGPDARYSWSSVDGGLPPWTNDSAGYTFVLFDAATAQDGVTQTVYAGVHSSGVWRSTDGGASWSNIGGADNPVRGTVASDGTLYVSFGTTNPASGSVRRFKDGEWADITPGDRNSSYTGISADPTDPSVIMVGRDRNVWRSTDGGTTWKAQKMIMHRSDPHDSGSNPSAPGYFLSVTAGASGGVSTVVIDPANPQQAWWINGWGAARTEDVTTETPYWAWQMNNLEELVGVQVRVPPKPKEDGGADLVSMGMDMIGFRHADKDVVPESKISPSGVPFNPNRAYAWQTSLFGGTTHPVPWPHVSMGSSLDYCYRNPDYMAFVGHLQWQSWPVYGYSGDNGRTWAAFPSVPKEDLWTGGRQSSSTPIAGQIAMSAADPQNIIWAPTWGTFDGGSGSAQAAPWPQYSTDAGKTWSLCKLAQPPAKPDPFDPQNNDHIHFDALPRSWANSIHPYVSTNILSADRGDPDGKTFYYFDGSAFYFSNDGGATWSKSDSAGFPSNIVRVTIASNPAAKGDVWLAFARNSEDVNGNKLLHSSDGGVTFTAVAGVDVCDKVAFGRGVDDGTPFIYILGRVNGATRDAIYKSEDGGQNWVRLSNPDTHAMMNVVHMEGDMRTPNLLYLALGGRGLMYGSLPAAPPPKPTVADSGVVNVGSLLPLLSRGALARVTGVDLASSDESAADAPLPTQLAGVMVTLNDQPVPLIHASSEIIDFQIPWEAPLEGAAELRIYSGLSASDPVPILLQRNAPGILESIDGTGGESPWITHGSVTPITQENPAAPDEEVTVWMTGFGDVEPVPESGFASPEGAALVSLPSATLDGVEVPVTYAALAPGRIGIAQIQLRLPSPLPPGNPLMLQVSIDGASSNAVPVWVAQ